MATINLLSKSSRDKILKSNIIADESGVGLKVTEQEAQKTLDISTSNIIVEINNVYADKIKIAQKKDDLCGILSGTCPLYSEMARIDFNGFSRGLSGIFSRINNFKSLE